MEELQSWWEVPTIAHFCHVFRTAFNLFHYDIEELEASLLQEAVDDNISVENLIIRLLPACCDIENIKDFDWENHLCQLLQKKWTEEKKIENPLAGHDKKFSCLPLRTKVEILYSLCHYRLDAEDVPEALKNMDSDDLRSTLVGTDSERNAYWYFSGIRLYKEDLTKKNASLKQRKFEFNMTIRKLNGTESKSGRRKAKRIISQKMLQSVAGVSAWSVACYTLDDWNSLVQALKRCRNIVDKKLSLHIEEHFLPLLPSIVSRQERELRKRIMELAPRRSSARIDSVRRRKQYENLTATKAAEDERAKKAVEDEKRLAEEEKIKKQREIGDRAKRAAERSKAIEDRAKRAKLRELRSVYSEDSDSLSGSVISTQVQSNSDINASDCESYEDENFEESDDKKDKLDNRDMLDEDNDKSNEDSENEEISSDEDSLYENHECSKETGKNFPLQHCVFSDGSISRYGQNYSQKCFNKSYSMNSRTQTNGAIVHRLTNYKSENKTSSDNLMERKSDEVNNADGNHNGIETAGQKVNWSIQKHSPVSCSERFICDEEVADMSKLEKTVHQNFYLKKEQNSPADVKFDLLNGMPKNFPSMHFQVIK